MSGGRSRLAGFDLAAVTAALAAAAPAADASGAFPWEGIRAVQAAGLLEATVGARYGGLDLSLGDLGRLLIALGRGDPSVALISSMTLFTHRRQAQGGAWPEPLYRRLLAESRAGLVLINAARVEPDLGSPSRGGLPDTIARRISGGWSISGAKRFVTGAGGLTHLLVWARTDESPARVGSFLVPTGAPGILIRENWRSLGMRATCSHDVTFEQVEIPQDHAVDLVESGLGQQDNLAGAATNLALTAIYLGAAKAAQEAFLNFAKSRVPGNLGRPLAQTERFIGLAGEIDLLVSGAEQIILQALDHAADQPETLLRARILAGRQLQQSVRLAVGALGNPGLSADNPLERHFRDIQSALVHAPQEDVVISILGRAAFAPPPPAAFAAPPLRLAASIPAE